MPNLIPQDIIDEVMARADIVDIVGEYVALKRRGRNHFGLCPFHNEDTPSFSVNQERQIYKCFGCGKGGNVLGFLREVENLTFAEAVEKLTDRYGITLPKQALSPEEQKRQQQRQSLLKIHELAADFYCEQFQQSRQAQAYLKKRGIESELAKSFGIGFAPEADWQALAEKLTGAGFGQELLIKSGLISRSVKNNQLYDKFHGRLIFPIRDQRGSVVAFGGRAMMDEQPKYLNSQTTPIYNKSQLLYGLDMAGEHVRSQAQVVIMEGYMDVLAAHQHGVRNAVASLGTAFTAEQARLLQRYAPEHPQHLEVSLAFDGDAAGEKATFASLEKLAVFDFIRPRVLVFPDGLDPDDFLKQEGSSGWERLMQGNCHDMLDYIYMKASAKHNAKTPAGKGAIVAELKPYLARVKSNTERDSFINRLARLLQVSERSIYADVQGKAQTAAQTTNKNPLPKVVQAPNGGHISNQHLLALSLSNEEIFVKACQELGDDFPSSEAESAVINLIKDNRNSYNFQPNSLLNYLDEENEGLRQFLLKLIQADLPVSDSGPLAESYILTIKKRKLDQKLSELQKQIREKEAAHEDVSELVKEKIKLANEKFNKGPL